MREKGLNPIEFWFDFSSGYAYFAALQVEALGRRAGRPILWRPFMLGAVFKITGSRGLSRTPLVRDYAHHDWQRIARGLGITFSLPAHHPATALAATRAFYWLEERDPQIAVGFAQAVFGAYFGPPGIDTGDLHQVCALAASHGLDPQLVVEGAARPDVKDRARALCEDAIARGVCGSPFFIVDGEPFWGWDRMPMMEQWLRTGRPAG